MAGLLLEELEEVLVAGEKPKHASSSLGATTMSTAHAV